jgi:hypothetical protein
MNVVMVFHREHQIHFTLFLNSLMKRNLLLLTVMMFVLAPALSAQPTSVKRFYTGFEGWNFKPGNFENCWTVGKLEATETTMTATLLKGAEAGAMINLVGSDWQNAQPRRGVDIYTVEKFGDCTIKLEFLILRRGNSGVYLMGEYEVQISDSFGKADDRLGQGDMGAIYSAAAPSTNAAKEPGTWQTYEIEFVAPKFDANGNKTANALFKKIILNGVVVQENIEVKGPTGGGLTMQEAPTGPLMLQGDHGPIAFRNIEIIVP